MSNRDLLRAVIANLNRMRARVALTAIGVFIGTAAVILLISLAIGLQTSATSDLRESFGDFTRIEVFQGGSPFAESGEDEPAARLDRAALRSFGELPHVVAVTPLVGLRGQASLSFGRLESFANIQGIDPDAAAGLGWRLRSGWPRLGRGQVVLGAKVLSSDSGPIMRGPGGGSRASRSSTASGLGGRSDAAIDMQDRSLTLELTRFNEDGEEISRNERLRVAGVLEESDGQDDFTVYAGLSDVESWNAWLTGEHADRDPTYDRAAVKIDDPANVEAVQAVIEEMDFGVFSASMILESINQFFVIVQLALGAVGAVAVVVAAIGIANTMTMAIYERTREIGIMKAVGATNRDVLRMFLAEAGAIGFLGGAIGTLVGAGVGIILDFLVRTQLAATGNLQPDSNIKILETPLWLMAFALAFATLIGLLSGVFPALRAASMQPLRALRAE